MAAHGAGAFLHGFEQCCLGLWRGAINFVGQHDVAEDRALDEGPLTMPGGEVFFNDVGAGNVGGHQVRRELDAPERQAERLRNGAHHQRLGGAGQAGDQAMPTDKERGKDLVQHILLADDYLAHLGENAITDRIEPFDALLQLGCVLAKFRDRDHRLFLPLDYTVFKKGGKVCGIPHLAKNERDVGHPQHLWKGESENAKPDVSSSEPAKSHSPLRQFVLGESFCSGCSISNSNFCAGRYPGAASSAASTLSSALSRCPDA